MQVTSVIAVVLIKEENDCTIGIRGLLSEFPEMSLTDFWKTCG
jgi:hypothetical protein